MNNNFKLALTLSLVTGLIGGNLLTDANAQFGGNGGNKFRRHMRFDRRHPRRAEVLGRDNNINRSLNQDRGHLGGNYSQLKAEDKSIRQQEQADAKANGGYITRQQKQQFNQEENSLRQQVNQDYNPR